MANLARYPTSPRRRRGVGGQVRQRRHRNPTINRFGVVFLICSLISRIKTSVNSSPPFQAILRDMRPRRTGNPATDVLLHVLFTLLTDLFNGLADLMERIKSGQHRPLLVNPPPTQAEAGTLANPGRHALAGPRRLPLPLWERVGVSFFLATSILAARVLCCDIFFDPALLRRTERSGNHPGPRKWLARSCSPTARHGSGVLTIRRQPRGPGWPPRAARSFRNSATIAHGATTRGAEARYPRHFWQFAFKICAVATPRPAVSRKGRG